MSTAGRTLIVGDIHGCLRPFEALLVAVQLTSEDHLVLLGDVVDRGPHSAGVIDRILALHQTHRVTVIQGNHEQMMLAARSSPDACNEWRAAGGDATLLSYGGVDATIGNVHRQHWTFLNNRLVDYVETETHLLVHAGVYPDLPMSEQPDYMLRWEPCDVIAPHASGKVIVCGHTPQRSGRPLNRGYLICLDTNACRGGLLTCLDARSGVIWQATADGIIQRSHLSDFDEG